MDNLNFTDTQSIKLGTNEANTIQAQKLKIDEKNYRELYGGRTRWRVTNQREMQE